MTNEKPTVAVIIPTFNRAHMVGAAIDSLLAQTRRPAQIIVVDDGSTDDTRHVLDRYSRQISVITQENRGLAAARNVGLSHITADYVAFLDSDDTLPPQSIQIRADKLDRSTEVDVIYGDAWLIYKEGRLRIRFSEYKNHRFPSGYVFGQLAVENLAPPHCFMFRRACLERMSWFDETLDTLEDHDFWLRMSTFAAFEYLDVPVADYIIHDTMMTRKVPERMRYGRLVVQKRAVTMSEFEALKPRQKAEVYANIAGTSLALGNMEEARTWSRRANQLAPSTTASLVYALSFLGARGTQTILAFRRKVRGLLRPETRMFYG